MTKNDFNKKADKNVNFIPPPQPQAVPENQANPLLPYFSVLESLRRPKQFVTVAPTFIPKNLTDQIQFYDDGSSRRVYFYFNGVWSHTTLT